MRPETVRRMLVLTVCAFGVGALYLVPGSGGGSGQRVDRTSPDPTRLPQGDAGEPDSQGNVPARAEPIAARGAQEAEVAGSSTRRRQDQRAAFTGDVRSPSAVDSLHIEPSRHRLTARWVAAADDVGVTAYVVELNGYAVAETDSLSVSVPWFNGTVQQVLRVRARDAAGNVGQPRTLLVNRPGDLATDHAAAAPGGATTGGAPASAGDGSEQAATSSASPTPAPASSSSTPATDASPTGAATPVPQPEGSNS